MPHQLQALCHPWRRLLRGATEQRDDVTKRCVGLDRPLHGSDRVVARGGELSLDEADLHAAQARGRIAACDRDPLVGEPQRLRRTRQQVDARSDLQQARQTSVRATELVEPLQPELDRRRTGLQRQQAAPRSQLQLRRERQLRFAEQRAALTRPGEQLEQVRRDG